MFYKNNFTALVCEEFHDKERDVAETHKVFT